MRHTITGRRTTSNPAAMATTQLKLDWVRDVLAEACFRSTAVCRRFRSCCTLDRNSGEAMCSGRVSLTAVRKLNSLAKIAAHDSQSDKCASTFTRSSPCNSPSRYNVNRPRMSSQFLKTFNNSCYSLPRVSRLICVAVSEVFHARVPIATSPCRRDNRARSRSPGK